MVMIEVIANDRLGKKVRVKVDSDDTVEILKVPPLAVSVPLGRKQDRSVVVFCRELTVENDCGTDGDRLAEDCA
jgi:hypothetical protein